MIHRFYECDADKINLIVHNKDNMVAKKLYDKLNFTLIGAAKNNILCERNHLPMTRLKRSF